jgi:hypothetical protein
LRVIVESHDGNKRLDINAKVFSRVAIDAVLDFGKRVAEADDGGLLEGIVLKTLRGRRQLKKF